MAMAFGGIIAAVVIVAAVSMAVVTVDVVSVVTLVVVVATLAVVVVNTVVVTTGVELALGLAHTSASIIVLPRKSVIQKMIIAVRTVTDGCLVRNSSSALDTGWKSRWI